MEKLKQSPAEILKGVEIQTIEQECLDRVFDFLCSRDTTKRDNLNLISAMDIARTLQFLGCRPTRADVELIIWVSFTFCPLIQMVSLQEVDDDLDGFVSK